jgi:predicted DNA-binding transcriptional regulator AlpA
MVHSLVLASETGFAGPSLIENFIAKDRLAELLGISVSHINKLMTEGLPCLKIGRAVRYRVSDVVMWLQKRSTR